MLGVTKENPPERHQGVLDQSRHIARVYVGETPRTGLTALTGRGIVLGFTKEKPP